MQSVYNKHAATQIPGGVGIITAGPAAVDTVTTGDATGGRNQASADRLDIARLLRDELGCNIFFLPR
jgi:hypothetical protein